MPLVDVSVKQRTWMRLPIDYRGPAEVHPRLSCLPLIDVYVNSRYHLGTAGLRA